MKSYLKFLSRNKLYATVEAAGLIFSLAFVIIIGCYAWEQYEVTRENPDRERVYALGLPDWYGLTLGFRDVAAARLPEIEAITHTMTGRMGYVKLSAGSTNTLVSYMFADGRFFDIFPQYEILDGSAELLGKGDHLMVSESFARAHEVRVGDLIDFGFPCTVCGIFADFRHTLMKPVDMIISDNSSENKGAWKFLFDGYGNCVPFVRLREGADFDAFMEKLEALCKELYPDVYGSIIFEYVTATRVDKIFFRRTIDSKFNRGDADTLRMLILVGLLLLVSAVFNYINLNTALSTRRAKEMAVRRLLGASRTGIIGKYIGESMLFTTLCFGAALLLAVAIAPVMDRLLNNPYITVRVLFSPVTVAGFAATVVIVGFLSGTIPAALASRYRPIDVIKGSFRAANKMTFSKVFIVLQNAFAVFMIAMALVMEAQYSCSLNRPKHAETDSLFYLGDPGHNLSLAEALRALPCVTSVGRTIGAPGFEVGGRFGLTRDGRDILYRYFMMDSTAFSMFKFEKVRDYAAPQAGAIWFGERAFTASGFDDENHDISVLRSRIGDVGEVGGTIREFPYNASNMGEEDYLMVHVLTDGQMESEFYYNLIIATTGDKAEARDRIMETYTKWCKDNRGFYSDPLYADFVDENYRRALEPARNNMRLMEIFMLLAIMISVLGLVAMSTYFAGQDAHSIAVRKVFGSTVEKETFRSVGRYMLYVGIACAVGVPVAVWAAGRYLQSFIYKLDHYGWIFIVAALLAAIIAAVSVLWQVLYSARTNPAVELKKE